MESPPAAGHRLTALDARIRARGPRLTTIVESPRLSAELGIDLVLASETLQYTGNFKFRAAYGVAKAIPEEHVLTESSGNFGQALAYACRLFGKRCTVVMPHDAARSKVEAVRAYGGEIEFVDVRVTPRAVRVHELAERYPVAFVARASEGPLVIEGATTLGREVMAITPAVDDILVPIGGGGLAWGCIRAMAEARRAVRVIGVEPAVANDAAQSFRAGRLVALPREPATIADGVRSLSLGAENWEALRTGAADVLEVSEAAIAEGVRLLFTLANLEAEPTGALPVAALLEFRSRFAGRRVCGIVTGGNVDAAVYAAILGGRPV